MLLVLMASPLTAWAASNYDKQATIVTDTKTDTKACPAICIPKNANGGVVNAENPHGVQQDHAEQDHQGIHCHDATNMLLVVFTGTGDSCNEVASVQVKDKEACTDMKHFKLGKHALPFLMFSQLRAGSTENDVQKVKSMVQEIAAFSEGGCVEKKHSALSLMEEATAATDGKAGSKGAAQAEEEQCSTSPGEAAAP